MKIYNMTEIKSLQKQRPRARQLIAVCLVLVMFFGNAFDYAIAFSERQNLDFALESDRYDLLVDHDELFDLSHWQLEDNELTELPPGILEALLREREEYFALSSRVREKAVFLELLDEGLRFSDLTEANRFFVFRQLDIACAAQEATNQLFEQMESDGFSLAESIELVRIISSGIFDYEEAQIIFNTIPSTFGRLIEVVYFEQFVQIFDVADKINARRLINMPFYSTNEFMGLYILIEEIREEEKDLEEEIKEEETQEETVELPPAEETTDLPSINGDSTEPKETDPPIIDENIPANGGYQSNDDEEHPMLDESGSVVHEQELMAGKRVILFEGHSSYLEEHISYSEEYFVDVDDDQIYREEDELILEDDEDYPINQEDDLILEDDNPIIEDDEDYPAENYEREQLEDVYSSRVMLADSAAFELARQMFLNNPLMIEIEATFIYGEILFSDLRVNLSEQEREHILLQRQSASYTSPEALANILFADVFFTSEDQHFRYLGELMFPHFKVRLISTLAYADFDEYGNIIDYELDIIDYNVYQAITPMSTIDHGDIVSSPFALRFNANESVSLNTGASSYRINIVNLPGRNGFNLNLDMVYSSSRAYSNGHGAISVFRNLHGLGEGWIFDLPYIWDNVLYVPGRGSFALSGNTILDYTLHDIRLENYTAFVSDTLRSNRRLNFHNGTSYFFNGAHIIGMVDRFGNTIRFTYRNVPEFNNLRLPFQIIDTNGKIIQISFFHTPASGGQAASRRVSITGPGVGRFQINMTRNERLPANAFLVSSIINDALAITEFIYSDKNVDLHFSNKNPSASGLRRDTAWLLTQVHYPAGAQLRFEYDRHNINLGRDGSRHVWRVSSRTLYNNGREYLRTTFGYEGDHTAFPQRVDRPPATHTYSTTVTQNNGVHTVYTFNYRHLNTSQRTYNAESVLLSNQIMTYNNDRLPISIETTEHRNNFSLSKHQEFTYNRYGQVTQVVSPLAQGSSHERYRIDYTFDVRFGLPLTRISRPNTTTTVVERNVLSADGRSVVREYIYENNARRSRTDFSHDVYGNIVEIREFYANTNASFLQTLITYESGTMPSLIRRTNVRDANGNLVGNIDRHFTYDESWRIRSETDPNGYVTFFQYVSMGRISRITFPDGGFVWYLHNDQRNTVQHRTALGAWYTYQYDGLGNLLNITVDGIEILRNVYDNRMRVIETRNSQGIASSQRETFTYDIFDRVVERRKLNPTGGILARETIDFADVFDAAGNRRITTTVVGTIATGRAPNIQTFVQYDRFGRRTHESTVGGRVVTYTHDLAGRVIGEQSLGVNNAFTYNVYGVASVRNILGHTAQNTYDMLGRLISSTDFMGNTERFTYDALGRLISHRIPFERTGNTVHYSEVRYFYDNNSNVIMQKNLVNAPGQAQVWATTENSFRHNRLVSSQTGGANGIRTTYTYNHAGNVLTKTVGGVVTWFVYNNRGQLIRTTDALGQTETFAYDANGHLVSHIDRNGTHFQMVYNNFGRIFRKQAWQNDELVVWRNYFYHATGALRQLNNGSHDILYDYDAQGRLIRQAETGGIVKTFAYNTANNMTQSRVYVSNVVQSENIYTFDNAQRVRTVTANGELVSTYSYNANSNRISTVSSNGLRTDYTHNLAGLVTNVTNSRNNSILSSFDYLFYLDGNTRQVTENLEGVRSKTIYTYDLTRRLVREEVVPLDNQSTTLSVDLGEVDLGIELTDFITDFAQRNLNQDIERIDSFIPDINERNTLIDFEPFGGAGGWHSVVTKNDGTVWTWGQNTRGQLGDRTLTNRHMPVQAYGLTDVIEASGSASNTVALRADGTVWVWGCGQSGQTGNDRIWISSNNRPTQVPGLTDFVDVSSGSSHVMALSVDGTVWAWGSNQTGQLGDGTTISRARPEQVRELANVIAISAGGSHSIALKADGTVWAWGHNIFGQLGDGTTTNRNEPVQVQNLTDVIAISASQSWYSVALKADGTVWAWGHNINGQLGDGTTTARYTPVQVQGLTDAIAISTGGTHSIALKADGTVWAWGNNGNGQLGNASSLIRHLTPVQVSNLINIAEILAGQNHVVAIREDGTVWAWGANGSGQLGDGTTTTRRTPVQVVGSGGQGFLNVGARLRPQPPQANLPIVREYTFDNRGNRLTMTVTGSENYIVTYTYDLNNRLLSSTRTSIGGIAEVTTFTYDNNGNQLTKSTNYFTETKVYNAFNQLISANVPARDMANAEFVVNTWCELKNAINLAQENVPVIIQIAESFSASEGLEGDAITVPMNRNITLKSSNEAEMTITQTNYTQRHFLVNGRLILGDGITLSGGNLNNTNNSGGVLVEAGGILIMHEGSTITNSIRTLSGGGVSVQSGTFIMQGGTISNNRATSGGGVLLGNGATFIMTGGMIDRNTATLSGGGGVQLFIRDTFIMHGGIISNNLASTNGGGVRGDGFIMSGGEIYNNMATRGGGVYGNNITMHGGVISNNTATSGGGVNGARFTMHGGTISHNTAKNGGGLMGGGFTIYDGAISNNSAIRVDSGTGNGGGIWGHGRMHGGEISNNTATSGGGIFSFQHTNTFTMTGGVISGNTALGTGGGGITFTGQDAKINIHGGEIINNVSIGSSGGILFGGDSAPIRGIFTMTGGVISGNSGVNGGGVGIASSARFYMRLPVSGEPNFGAVSSLPTISNNTATGSGGGVNNRGLFTMDVGQIINNTANVQGGGISSALENMTIGANAIVSDNAPDDMSSNALALEATLLELEDDLYIYYLTQNEYLYEDVAIYEIDNRSAWDKSAIMALIDSTFEPLTNTAAVGMIVTYTYRADGLRHSKTVNGVTTTHVWLMGSIILERDSGGAIINQFDRSLTGRLIRSEQHGYYLHNARGDIVQRVNAQGRVIRNYRYTAFGVELNPNENNRNPFRFAGEYWDAETGTYYLRARNFNPRTGRFTQPDPYWNIHNMQSSTNAILQAGNLFMYTMHNPVKWVDPLGLAVVLPSGGVQLSSGIVLRPGAMTLPRGSSTVSGGSGSSQAVMLSYIVSKNSGTMNVSSTHGEVSFISVQIGGTTQQFIVGRELSLHHGHWIIYSSHLINSFGLTETQATHQPWDSFSSMDTAAIAFGLMHTDRATAMNREIGAMIYSVTGTSQYTFGNTWVGRERDVAWGFVMRLGIAERCRSRYVIAALAHTHPFDSNRFSKEDMQIAHGEFNTGFGFIGVPTMPVFMSVNIRGGGMEVRRYDNTMNRNNAGRLLFSR